MAAHIERVSEDIEPGDARCSGGSWHVPGQDAHGGGLPGAVGAEKSENFALVYSEGDVVDCCDRTVGFGQVRDFNQSVPPNQDERR